MVTYSLFWRAAGGSPEFYLPEGRPQNTAVFLHVSPIVNTRCNTVAGDRTPWRGPVADVEVARAPLHRAGLPGLRARAHEGCSGTLAQATLIFRACAGARVALESALLCPLFHPFPVGAAQHASTHRNYKAPRACVRARNTNGH